MSGTPDKEYSGSSPAAGGATGFFLAVAVEAMAALAAVAAVSRNNIGNSSHVNNATVLAARLAALV